MIKVDRIKQETGWDIEALKAWEEALNKRDDDNELIKKFSKEDERRFNKLEARRQFLQSEYDAKNLTISKMVCDLHSCEMIIERTGKTKTDCQIAIHPRPLVDRKSNQTANDPTGKPHQTVERYG